MSTCARCGSSECLSDNSYGHSIASDVEDVLRCRDRELANLRALLRSVTGKLEEASERLQLHADNMTDEVRWAGELIDQVLEALS